MENSLLSKLGFDPAYLLIALFLIQIVLVVFLVKVNLKYERLKISYNSFMKGKDGKNLEERFIERFSELDKILELVEKNKKDMFEINRKASKTYQKMGIVKYDAFEEMGGKLSFALTMLDDNNNGWILNVLHSTDGSYSYIKEIVNGQSYIELGEEERESLDRAIYQEVYDLKGETTFQMNMDNTEDDVEDTQEDDVENIHENDVNHTHEDVDKSDENEDKDEEIEEKVNNIEEEQKC